jgi:hypothetical protein
MNDKLKLVLEGTKKSISLVLVVVLCLFLLSIGVIIGVFGTISLIGTTINNVVEDTQINVNFDLNETALVNQAYLLNQIEQQNPNETIILV